MISTWKNRTALAVLALALFGLGCESGTEPGARGEPLEVQSSSNPLLGDELGSELSFAHRTVAKLSDEVVRKTIGAEGGTLSLDGHSLTVPPNAVDRPTLFVMAVLAGTEIQVELIAYDPDLYLDVGEGGFNIPVQLALSYAGMEDPDPDKLVIVHVTSDGERIELASTVDEENQVVRAELEHFSRYALCTN
ncbi:MAG: hypothetical protein KY466_15830 [Gemmatimonadetes bacterium]|nr:hypothetical protein [Gemmatimonadota bacterium]